MGLNATNLVLQVKGDKSIASGFDHATRTGDNTFSIFFIDGSKVDLTIPLPKDGKDAVDIVDVNDLGNGKFTLLLSDGSETSAVQTIKGLKGDKGDKLTFNDLTDAEKESLKGDDGVSPTITENADNTDKIYKLDITTADTTFTTPNLKGADGQGGSGGSGTAEDTTYTNENYPQYTNVDLALDALFNKVYYVKPTCSLSASKAGGTFEMGTTISAPITFTWTTNKDITSQTLTGCTLADASVRTATYNTNVTADKTFTLSVSDGENSASSSVSYKFLNKIHWGNAIEPDTYDSTFILGLANSKLASSNKGSFSFNAGNGEYCYFATPASMKVASAWVNGFQADLEEVATVSHTNASGYTTNYTITRFANAGLGSFSADVK